MKIALVFSYFIALYFTLNLSVLASINVDETTSKIEISKDVQIVKMNREYKLNQDSIKALKFYKNDNNSLALGYNNGKSLIKFTLNNTSNADVYLYFYIDSINGKLKLYSLDKFDHWEVDTFESGTDIPFKYRNVPSLNGALKIHLNKMEEKTFFVEIISRHNINGKIYLSSEKQLFHDENYRNDFLNFYLGGIVLLVIYNLLIFFLLKDFTYLYYCFYAQSFVLTSLVIFGRLDQIIKVSQFTFSHYLICFSSFSIISATLFTKNFLEIKKHIPTYNKYFNLIIYSGIILFISGLFPLMEIYPKFFGIAIDLTIFFALTFFIFTAIKLFKINVYAKFYLLSWLLVFITLCFWFGMTFGLLKVNQFTINALPIGNILEMLTLSFALAYRIQLLNKEKLEALIRARDKEKYERLVRVLSHDVANSLTVINSYSKRLSKSNDLEESLRMQAEKIYLGSENIKNVLQIVREQEVSCSQGHGILVESINVLECIQFSLTLYEEQLRNKNIQVITNISDDLKVKADKTCFINNILNNLISNAIKFSFNHSQIEIFSVETANSSIIAIKDNGTGIKSDLINDIYFSEKIISTSGTENEKGTGFGANLVREYMLLFGGKIQVTSLIKDENTLSHGTTIKLIFPKES